MSLSVSLRSFFTLFARTQLLPVLENGEEILVGGQAVVEGVMMRAPHSYCVAVRKTNGEIVTEEMPLERISERHKIFKYPVVRGLGVLYQSMKLGVRALRFSANIAAAEIGETEEKKSGKPQAKEIPGWAMAANLAFSLVFFIVAYKLVPLYLARQLKALYPNVAGSVSLTDGIIRIVIFLAFLYLISRFKDIRRMFEYHGAEHKVVFNFESGKPVTVTNAQQFTTFHPRCGTSFLMLLMIVSMAVYPLIPYEGFAAMFVSRLVLLPFIIGISYEIIRFAAKHPGTFLTTITAPGMWLQRITTQPPSDEQAAVAIHALTGAMALEESQGGQLIVA